MQSTFVSLRSLILAGSLSPLLLSGCSQPSASLDIVTMSDEAASAQADSIRQTVSVDVADGLELSLWASEDLVADPIALAIDDKGTAWLTRTIRQKHSEFDIRGYRQWMIESIALKTVEERRAFLRETLAPERSAENMWLEDLNGDSLHDWRDLTVEKERAYFVQDISGDGRADRAQLYIEDFHEEITDIAGAVLPVGDDVYLGVGPDMWRLQDTSGDGMADKQTSISHGYGVHIGFSGHNMSGLTRGPDGRIYWSIGDIGFSVRGPDGTLRDYPHQGAILRSELDGSGFEVFAAGVRNTHEFMFDKYGNLISVDNDGDHAGETERIVYLVNGSDSGWRANWQYGKYVDPDNNGYKVWMDEGLFRPRFDGQAAYILPPVASYHAGPAGMAYNPGTALSRKWQDRFFVAEFVGSPSRSRIWAFSLAPKGAGFEFTGDEVVARGILATGIDFGPDGALYAADWIEGWDTNDLGRIWKLDTPETAQDPIRAETRALLAEDMSSRSAADLAGLLRHDDMRVRMKAQFELADRGESGILQSATRDASSQLGRLHGIWGLGQLARTRADEAGPLVALLADADPEVRAQAAKVLGDVRYMAAADQLLPLLTDSSARVRFFACEALGRMAFRPAVEPILTMLERNNDEDAYLRHGGAIALARIGDVDALTALVDHPSRALRTVAVVALRRMRDPGVALFLGDRDEYVVTEAARAINDDESIQDALPALARVLSSRPAANEALVRRALSANLRLGGAEQANAVAAFAASPRASDAMKAEAIAVLGVWPRPSTLDRVDGAPRGAVSRDAGAARAALKPVIQQLLSGGGAEVRLAAAETAGHLELSDAMPAVAGLLKGDPSVDVRLAALGALHSGGYPEMESAVRGALKDRDGRVRMAALGVISALPLSEDRIVALLESVLDVGTTSEQQSALAALGELGTEPAQSVLASVLERLEDGSLPTALQIDALDAIEHGGGSYLAERLEAYRAGIPSFVVPSSREEVLATYAGVLEGGDPRKGARVVNQNPAAQCVRCHAFGDWGGDVGPDLSQVGLRMTPEELLESLVAPSLGISPGYGSVTLTLDDGSRVQGLLQQEDAAKLVVQTSDGEVRTVPLGEIAGRVNDPSGMPPMGLVLSRRELRDVVAYLSTLGKE